MNCDLESESIENDLRTLEQEIQMLKQTADLLLHRLDSMERSLEQDTFQLATRVIQLKETPHTPKIKLLLKELFLEESTLTLGLFLKALNQYLIHHALVDLNDLHLYLNPLLQAVFQSKREKVPYGFFLKSLPELFV